MWRESDLKRSSRSKVCVCPQIAQPVACSRETKIAPAVMNGLGVIADIEDCDVRISTRPGPRRPNYNAVSGDDRMILSGVLIDRDDRGVGKQRRGPVIGLQQIATHDQRRAED